MKTMKVRLTQIILAAFLAALLIGGNVNAKGTEVVVVSGLENIVEQKLEVENWMVDENYWNTVEDTYVVSEITDESLALEAWMLDENKWETAPFRFPSPEAEEELLLESWMVNEIYWN